ncbi:heavy metal translocating P-type ATPase [Corynebacterium timonense]|uniref:ATPase, P-type (Transporting), HAD superfamily, subfamily IC n=1 Tax=Corynebacterium timonense TaxID=441500 RepID=A0A1H1T7E3_9CORY|nr:HAD family hydrolase [Corynebacterium timonense]SDS55559.1 ATPase, P-type (transporting), HAD superfamily, subfamily IC [Corynebacterium timonense]
MAANHVGDGLDASIVAARVAARNAGFDLDAPHERDGTPMRPNASYAFVLEGIEDAPQMRDIEEALDKLEGVTARLVYPSSTAWVTAAEDMDPARIVEVIESFGVRADMTDSTLRRRAVGRRAAEHPLPRRGTRGMTGKMRRQRRDEEANLVRERAEGFMRGEPRRVRTSQSDVLFTARDLVTPLRMWLAILITIPVCALSYIPELQFAGWQWVCLALSTPVALWCAFPFHRAMAGGVRRGLSALDGASSIAILASYVWSLCALVFTPAGEIGWSSPSGWLSVRPSEGMEIFLDVACGVTAMLLVGRANSVRVRSYLLRDMALHSPDPDREYTVFRRNRATDTVVEERLPISEINRGHDVKVTAGEVVPVDGDVVGGSCELRPPLIDAREPAQAKVGTRVYAGSVVDSGSIKVRAVRTGHSTRWAVVHGWVEEASRRENAAALLSTRTAGMLIPAAYFIAFADFCLWFLITGNPNVAFSTAVAILAVVAPVALAISPSVAIRLGIEAAARNGILLRDGESFRGLENTDTVVFNRVGTLVTPTMYVETVTAERGEDSDLVLRIAAALSTESQHPMGKALVKAARESRDMRSKDSSLPSWIELNSTEITAEGDVKGRLTLTYDEGIGTDADAGEERVEHLEATLWRPTNLSSLHGRLAIAATSGGTPVVVRWKGRDRGVITLYDPAKPDAIEAVQRLEDMGIETVMLTRDTYPVARRFADFLGVSNVLAGIPGPSKPLAVRALRNQGATVTMVGDHTVMDTLRGADVGVMYVTEESVAARLGRVEGAAHAVLLRHDVTAMPQLIELARRVSRIIDSNMFFAWSYNAVAIVLAVAGLLPPVGATLLMLGSSTVIELRSVRARRFPT